MREFFEKWDWVGQLAEWTLAFFVLIGIHKLLKRTWKKISTWRSQMVMRQVKTVWFLCKDLWRITRCERVLICKTHDGDGLPKLDHPTKVSILYEECGRSLPIMQDWQDRLLTGEPSHVIGSLIEHDKFDLYVANLENGEYRGIFRQHNVRLAIHHTIKYSESGYIFLIVWFKEDMTLALSLRETLDAQIGASLEKMKKAFRNREVYSGGY